MCESVHWKVLVWFCFLFDGYLIYIVVIAELNNSPEFKDVIKVAFSDKQVDCTEVFDAITLRNDCCSLLVKGHRVCLH